MYDICALGEVLIDAIASADTCIQITGNAGGAPANVLTCGTRMGLKTAFLAKPAAISSGTGSRAFWMRSASTRRA